MSNTLSQWAQLLYYVYAGTLMGLIYDCLGLFRTENAFLNAAADAVFWGLALWTAADALLCVSGYELRLFAIVCFAAGFAAFKATVSVFLRPLLTCFARAAAGFVSAAARLFE